MSFKINSLLFGHKRGCLLEKRCLLELIRYVIYAVVGKIPAQVKEQLANHR